MADTTSIASRMEKLAKLKRMKESMTAQSSAAQATSAPQTETASPITAQTFENVAVAEPILAADSGNSISEETAPADVIPTDVTQTATELSDESFDFDPANIREEDLTLEGESLESTVPDEEAIGDATSPDTDVNFIMESQDEPATDDANSPIEIAEADLQEIEGEDNSLPDFSATSLGIEDDDEMAIAAITGIGDVESEAAPSAFAASIDEEFAQSLEDTDLPDFSTNEIDEEVLNREFDDETVSKSQTEEPRVAGKNETTAADENAEGRITVAFDESRSTLLDHVSRQMNCSVEDVVVTALDWYLDALFGEDGEAKSA